MMGGGWGLGFGLIGMFLNLLFIVALLAGVVLLGTWLWRRASGGGQPEPRNLAHHDVPASPKEVAALRYARGEITREQYQQILADLSQ